MWAGAVFKPHLDALLHNLDDGIAAVSQLIDPDTGTVALGFQQSLGTWLVPDLARSFRTAHPRVRFQLTQVRDEPNSAALDDGLADLELGSRRPNTPPDADVHTRLIALEPLRLALPREHPLAAQRRVRLADVADEPFISLRSASALRRLTDNLCEQAGFRPDVIFEGDDLSNVRGFVAAGLGVAVVPAPRAGSPEAVPGPVTYTELADPGAAREILLTWSAERRLLPATDLFRRHVIRRAAAGRAASRLGLRRRPWPRADGRTRSAHILDRTSCLPAPATRSEAAGISPARLPAGGVIGQFGHVGLAFTPGGDLLGTAVLGQVVRNPVLDVVPYPDRLDWLGPAAGPERGQRRDHRVQGRVDEDRGRAAGHRAARDHPVPARAQPPAGPPGEQ